MALIHAKYTRICIIVFIGIFISPHDSWAISSDLPQAPEIHKEEAPAHPKPIRFTPKIPQDPEIPWWGDPDISALDEERLVHLWDEVVRGYRRKRPTGGDAVGMLSDLHYTPYALAKDDREYLLNTFDREIHSEATDWNCVYTVLLLMNACMIVDSRIPDWVRYLAKLPRPIKMSDVRGGTYMRTLTLLEVQNNPEATAVLAEATTREFWGDYPMHSRRLDTRCTEKSILSLREAALYSFRNKISPEIGFPHIQKLAETHALPPDCDADEESRFICSIHHVYALVQERLAAAAKGKREESGQE